MSDKITGIQKADYTKAIRNERQSLADRFATVHFIETEENKLLTYTETLREMRFNEIINNKKPN